MGEFLDDATGVFRNVDRCIGSQRSGYIPGKTYFLGVDLAKHVDFTVMTILDGDGNQVYWNRINQFDWPYQKQLIAEIAKSYGAKVLIDSTGIGDPIFDDLRRAGLDITGYKFTSESKRQLVEALMLSLEQEKIRLLSEPIQINEMKMFGYEITASGIKYNAPEGKHDDCVFALALANWARSNTLQRRIVWI